MLSAIFQIPSFFERLEEKIKKKAYWSRIKKIKLKKYWKSQLNGENIRLSILWITFNSHSIEKEKIK
jgi:hypothetical protein